MHLKLKSTIKIKIKTNNYIHAQKIYFLEEEKLTAIFYMFNFGPMSLLLYRTYKI